MRRYLPFIFAVIVIAGAFLMALRINLPQPPPPAQCVCSEKPTAMQQYAIDNPPETPMSPRLQRLAAEEKAGHSQ
jgi:hypothetical protein